MVQKREKFYPKVNALKQTFCVFAEVSLAMIEGLEPDFSSKSGSMYFYTEKGLFRYSNHWGRLANSKWRLVDSGLSTSKFKVGFACWDEFYPDNDWEALYYLEWDRGKNEILYQHKNRSQYDGKAILRTAPETMKRLKNARNILNLSNWAKYYEEDIEVLRAQIIEQLIFTNLSLEEIKRNLK